LDRGKPRGFLLWFGAPEPKKDENLACRGWLKAKGHLGKFPPQNLRYEELLDPVSEAASAISRYDQMLASMHNSEILLAPLRNQEAVVSSRMEGTISTLDEVLRIEAEGAGDQDDAFRHARSEAVETYLYTRAMQRIQKEIEAGRPLSEFLIRQAHQILQSFGRGATKSPGSYKTEQNYIGEKRRQSVSFVPISPQALPMGMQSPSRTADTAA
jgi:Fic family protein